MQGKQQMLGKPLPMAMHNEDRQTHAPSLSSADNLISTQHMSYTLLCIREAEA